MLKTVTSCCAKAKPALSLLAVALAMPSLLAAGQADAAPAATHLDGQIAQICRIEQSPGTVSLVAHVGSQGEDIGRVTFAPSTHAGDVRLTCNVQGSSLRIAASAMKLQDQTLSDASYYAGFTDTLDYDVSLTGPTAYDSTSRIGTGTAPSGEHNGVSDHEPYGVYGSVFAMTIGHVSARDNRKPVAGGYRGVIRVTISP